MKNRLFFVIILALCFALTCACAAAVQPETPASTASDICDGDDSCDVCSDVPANWKAGIAYINIVPSDSTQGHYTLTWAELVEGADETDYSIKLLGSTDVFGIDADASISVPFAADDLTIPDLADIQHTDVAGLAKFIQAWQSISADTQPLFALEAVDGMIKSIEYFYLP
ncbi:MAG: hypothetical protein RR232_08355 [Clostridia bacterium]